MVRKISVFLVMLCLCLMQMAYADANSPEEFAYIVHEDHTEILAFIGTKPTVEVPAYIEGKPVTTVRLGRSYYGDQADLFLYVRKVILPETVTTLSDFAFGQYSMLSSVEGLEYVEHVGNQAFWGSGLQEAVFSDRLCSIQGNAFSSSSIHTLTLPDDVECLNGLTLSNVEHLTIIDGSDSPTIMQKDGMVLSADGTVLLSVMASMRNVRLVIPDGITDIMGSALSNLNFVDEIVFPRDVQSWSDVYVRSGTTLYVYAGSPLEAIIKENMRIYDTNFELIVMEEDEGAGEGYVEAIVSEVIKPGMSDYEKAKALHDWIIQHGSYDYTLSNFDASSILSGGAGVCDAYTRAYCILLSEVGIENRRETCYISGAAHAITALRLDGEWYLVDCTNDDEGFGAPDALFCFDQRVFNAFYSGSLSVNADSIDLYAPYVSGKLDVVIHTLATQTQQHMEQENTIFTIAVEDGVSLDPIHAQAICSIMESMQWTLDGEPVTLKCSYMADGCYQCVLSDVKNEYGYYEMEDGVCLMEYLGDAAAVTVPDEYQGMKVIALEGTFRDNKSVKAVTLPQGLNMIGQYTFSGCTNLAEVNIPDSVTVIGARAFTECISLSGSIVLPDGLKQLDEFAFAHCLGITEINLPAGIAVPGAAVFAECVNLEQVTLEAGLQTVSNAMFHGCVSLKYVTLPNTVTTIDHGAFTGSGLLCLDLPASVGNVAWDAFFEANRLQLLTVQSANPCYAAVGNILYSKDMTELLVSTPAIDAHLQIPEGVQTIGSRAFAMNKTLRSVHIPSTVRTIQDYAFIKSDLQDVYIEDGTHTIGNHVFAGNGFSTESVCQTIFAGSSGLSSIRLPQTLTNLGEGALYGHHYFDYLILPSSLTTINVCFIDAPITLYVPSSITYIAPQKIVDESWREYRVAGAAGTYAETFATLEDCVFINTAASLTLSHQEVTLLELETLQLSVSAVSGLDSLPSNVEIAWSSSSDCVQISNGMLTAVSNGTATITAEWNGMTGVCEVQVLHVLPESLSVECGNTLLYTGQSTHLWAWANCCPDDSEIIYTDVFRHGVWTASNEAIIQIETSQTIRAIGVGKCTITFTLPGGESRSLELIITGVPSTAQNTLELPESLSVIEAEAFVGVSASIVILPDGCREIQSRAFADNPGLEYVYIPASVTSIAPDAFEGCPDVIIAASGEYAHLFAQSRGITFVSVE